MEAGLLLHDNFYNNSKLILIKMVLDLPTGNTFRMVNRYKFDNSKPDGTVWFKLLMMTVREEVKPLLMRLKIKHQPLRPWY